MHFLFLILGLSCSSLFSHPRLEQQSGESFFDYVCRIKELDLNPEETSACKQYLQEPTASPAPYLNTLQSIFREQLRVRMGYAMDEAPEKFVDKKVAHLMRMFLKDKLALVKTHPVRQDLAQRAKWDPHYHGSSLFADYFPKAKLYLPNYEEAYGYIKGEHRKLRDRTILIKRSMEEESFASVTEAGSGYDQWHIAHANKRIIPIFCHKREDGVVLRHDVLGYDMCGLELEDRYISQKAFLESVQKDKVVRLHMGETIIPERGRENVHLLLEEAEKYYTSSKPLRIGHGTHISIEDMLVVAEKGYFIEACLSSNKRTGIIDKRSDYPLGLMLLLGVNVVIGTDGGRLYSTTLAEEYAHAVRSLKKFRIKLKNSNEPIILPNGDCLRYKHIASISPAAKSMNDKVMTYKELGACLDPVILAKVSEETLVSNATLLLQRCYEEN